MKSPRNLGACWWALWLLLFVLPPLTPAGTFVAVTNSFVIRAGGETLSAAWGDLDGDGHLDLGVANLSPTNFFFRGTEVGEFFPQALPGPFSTTSAGIAFGDFDNDGDLDVFLASIDADLFFRNQGRTVPFWEQFPSAEQPGAGFPASHSASLVDVDNDGWLDAFATTGGGLGAYPDILYLNQGGQRFVRVTDSPLTTLPGASYGASWADYDDDGRLDVLIPNGGVTRQNFLFHNEGNGRFTRVLSGPVAEDRSDADGSAWGDYDNDGDFDLFVASGSNLNNVLYRNDGGGHFTRITQGAAVSDGGYSVGTSFGDYDNDGWLDLIVANRLGPAFLYHNLGDGTFERVVDDPVAQAYTDANAVSFVDFDLDGFLDVFIGNWSGEGGPSDEMLFRNLGNPNAWLKVQPVGRYSNRSGIGAKVRVKADIAGVERNLVRQIGGFDSAGSTTLDAHFGLGNATVIKEVRIEWPSGIVQTVNNVAPRQTLTLTEPDPTPGLLSFVPPAGTFTNGVKVAIQGSAPAALHYTLDNSPPTASSPQYSGPITLRTNTTIQARAFLAGTPIGEVATAAYTRIYAHPGDGIAEAWRETYFGPGFSPLDPRVGSESDPDGDGASNLQEYWAKTHPLDAQSALRIGIKAVPQIRWISNVGVTYQVRRHDPHRPGTTVAVGNPVTGTGAEVRVVDDSSADPFSLYSVEVLPPGQ